MQPTADEKPEADRPTGPGADDPLAGYRSLRTPGSPPPPRSPFRQRQANHPPWTLLFTLALVVLAWFALCAGMTGIGWVIAGIGLIVFGLGAAVGVAVWVLGPIDRAAKEFRAPMQFTLVDFLCLFFLVQLPMALIHGLLSEDELAARWILDIYAWCAIGAFWTASVHFLSRAGIGNPRHRAVFLSFVAPSAIAGAIVLPSLTAVALVALAHFTNPFSPGNRIPTTIGTLVYIGLLAAVFFSGRFTRTIVAAAARQRESADAPSQTPDPQHEQSRAAE